MGWVLDYEWCSACGVRLQNRRRVWYEDTEVSQLNFGEGEHTEFEHECGWGMDEKERETRMFCPMAEGEQ